MISGGFHGKSTIGYEFSTEFSTGVVENMM
jgi:hypothetical protein